MSALGFGIVNPERILLSALTHSYLGRVAVALNTEFLIELYFCWETDRGYQ
jgi:hypothetical protein